MGQRPSLVIFFALLASLPNGCDRNPAPAAPATQSATSSPTTVASLSPAATEILIGLGLRDRLVAVSNFEPPRDAIKDLPRIGDYQTSDWERIASLRPSVMITQFASDRLPTGLAQKAEALDIKLVNVPITRLDDIYAAMTTLATAMGDAARGVADQTALKYHLDAIRSSSASKPKIRALIVVDESARGVVGRENYLNDILEIAGGENVIKPGSAPYPMIDRETLLALDPQVIFQLLPSASQQVQQQAKQFWQSLPQLQAVRYNRVHVFTELYVLQPSQHVGDLAERFATALAEARSPSTQPAAKGTP